MAEELDLQDAVRQLTAPADLFVGTGSARPISVRNVLAFCRMKAKELGAKRSLHHRYVLCFNLHGSSLVTLILNTVAMHLSPDRYILLTPHQLHTYSGLDEREVAILFVTFETEDADLLLHVASRIMEITPSVRAALAAFIEEYTKVGSIRHDNLVVLATQTLLEAIICNDADGGKEAHVPLPAPLRDVMLKLSGMQAPTVLAVTNEAGLSEAHLRKLFKKHMGISMGHYLTEMRQNKARSLLGASEESISQISELCGYKSLYAFSRAFHQFNGCTPSLYRSRIRNTELDTSHQRHKSL